MASWTSAMPLFEIRDLCVSYGDHEVLHGIHADIPAQEVTAMLGPSGCGKSTLLRVLNRTLELIPTARIIRGGSSYRGEDLQSLAVQRLRQRIGIVQQKPLPFPMSIRDNVVFGAAYHRKMRGAEQDELAQVYLEKVGLWDEVRHRLKTSGTMLSIGQQQRLCIARSLANGPEVLLMDEPCSALDPASTKHIEDLILRLKQDMTIIIVTHNLAQARRVSTNCLFFLAGRIAEQGTTEHVLHRPEHPGVRAIVMGQEG